MKRFVVYSLLGLSLLTSACQDDFLDRVPLDELVDETYWENEEQLRLATDACYAYLKAKNTVDMENLGDNTIWPSVTDYQRIASGNFTNDIGALNNEWTGSYDGIRRCNAFLANYQRAEVTDPARKEALAAEVRVIRAYLYSYLTTFYGDVQLVTTPLEIDDPLVYGTRTPRAEVVDFMLKELDEAAAALPAAIPTGANLGRISRGAALALKARVALQNQRYAAAEQAAKAVMDLNVYQLYTAGGTANAYRNLFTYAGKLAAGANKETILARTHLADISMHNLSREIQVPDQNARWNPTKSLVDSYLCSDGLPIEKSPLYKDTTYADVFKNRDPRMVQTILQPGAAWGGRFDGNPQNTNPAVYTTPKFRSDRRGSVTITGYYFTKYVELSTVGQVSRDANDIHLIRLAEVLLIYAEARLEQNKLTQADVDLTINKLRQRVGMRAMDLAELTTNGLDVRTELRRERRVELALEGQRYFDILRWQQGNLLAEDVKGMKKAWARSAADVANQPTDANGFIIVNRNRTFTASRNYLWPMPLVQLERNPNLGQNPGW
ncbi:RagB/SusD family nutrient uptake outer membrane protein [Hymenobacter defluvii]|uniref:RagB/SusD family nutrient uptake outer membrane protein n=1 Tax=Hymenobacter defluvii TaxID=2054411 RepID=A0ABS3TCV4_9BACT|nr:RagB/SusD family nutrient uptake outer membrane protein [Hymenobacter defluvii]MBO3270464.1 RagB/SusD family nutrient uptake outer membrane protein [Hymenobacter defluvii]